MIGDRGAAQHGSALVVAMLVTTILALLGLSFLVLAETERRIAENEERAAQALYVAEAGLRAVKRWFDDPRDALGFPTPAVVDRTLRRIIDETDPRDAAAVPADGLVGSFPYYKQGQDRNGDAQDDLFERPYRGALVDVLRGTAEGPDLRIDDASSASASYLASLSTMLVGPFPDEPGAVHARISRIDVYAPPYEQYGATTWQRGGIASVAVTARVYQDLGSTPRVLAERRLEGVLSEAPYRVVGLQGPLHSCGDLEFVPRTGGDLTVRWGPMIARGQVRVGNTPEQPPVPRSLPRRKPSRPGSDPLFPADAEDFGTFLTTVVGDYSLDDPWFRILSGGTIQGTGGSAWPRSGTLVPAERQDYSNLMPNIGVAACPRWDYRVWKAIAQSGGPDVHYFAWDEAAQSFRENGRDAPRSFREATNGRSGVYFFDTRNGEAPHDDDANGSFDNLTEGVELAGGAWSFSGFVFLNARSFRVDGISGVATTLRPPAEPFLDLDNDGAHDAGEPFVNLDYTSASATDGRVQAFTTENGQTWDARGPDVAGSNVSMRGILHTTGSFEATGAGTFYGVVAATGGVTQSPDDGSAVTPTLIWDGTLASEWPPEDLPGVPRVVITDWQLRR